MRERIGYYDVARGMGIIFVIIGHIDSFYMPFRSVVITFHMALFLMISGMLFMETGEEEKNYWKVVKKKFGRIMVPYFLFSLLSIGIEFLRLALQGVYHWPHFKALFISVMSLYGNSVMWFLPALFISELVFLAIRKLKNDFVTIMLVACLAVIAIWGNTLGIDGSEIIQKLFATLVRGVYCTVFICIGYYVRKYIVPLKIPGYLYGCLGVLFLGICVKMNEINPKVDLRAMRWGEYIFATSSEVELISVRVIMYLTGAVLGALGIIFLCKAASRFNNQVLLRILSYFGCNSLIIMATHLDFHVLHYSMDLGNLINSMLPNSILYHTCVLVFVLAAEAVLIELINKYIPVLAGKQQKLNS